MNCVYDFSGSVVLITGGASGIGAATAHACAAAGATVIAADVDASRFATLQGVAGLSCRQTDVADPRAVEALVADIVRDHGQLDAAVLGAAIQIRAPLESISDETWRRHFAVNVDGVFHCLRAVIPVMKGQRRGAIVGFTSGLVESGWPGAAAYAASKGALLGLFKCAALELREFGVRANILSPGLVATPVFLNVASEQEIEMYRRTIGVSAPEDVVPSVLYLISEASANLTGTVLQRRLVPE